MIGAINNDSFIAMLRQGKESADKVVELMQKLQETNERALLNGTLEILDSGVQTCWSRLMAVARCLLCLACPDPGFDFVAGDVADVEKGAKDGSLVTLEGTVKASIKSNSFWKSCSDEFWMTSSSSKETMPELNAMVAKLHKFGLSPLFPATTTDELFDPDFVVLKAAHEKMARFRVAFRRGGTKEFERLFFSGISRAREQMLQHLQTEDAEVVPDAWKVDLVIAALEGANAEGCAAQLKDFKNVLTQMDSKIAASELVKNMDVAIKSSDGRLKMDILKKSLMRVSTPVSADLASHCQNFQNHLLTLLYNMFAQEPRQRFDDFQDLIDLLRLAMDVVAHPEKKHFQVELDMAEKAGRLLKDFDAFHSLGDTAEERAKKDPKKAKFNKVILAHSALKAAMVANPVQMVEGTEGPPMQVNCMTLVLNSLVPLPQEVLDVARVMFTSVTTELDEGVQALATASDMKLPEGEKWTAGLMQDSPMDEVLAKAVNSLLTFKPKELKTAIDGLAKALR
jgi:hypothetical protein